MRKKLIKWLGGFTEQEVSKSYTLGKLDTINEIFEQTQNLYGTASDVWCDAMYNTICDIRKDTHDQISQF